MKHIVHIYGPCGSGTSTLGREIGRRLGFRFLDTDDFFWLPTDPQYTQKRPLEERLALLEDHALEIVVKDWGVGIENVEKAREPLFTTGNQERAGMGFTIMESFMDVLKVRSTPGKGTTVTMRRKIARRAGR